MHSNTNLNYCEKADYENNRVKLYSTSGSVDSPVYSRHGSFKNLSLTARIFHMHLISSKGTPYPLGGQDKAVLRKKQRS